MGAKYKYKQWMCDCVLEVASVQGQYQAAMLLEIGRRLYGRDKPISPDTFARWRKENPELEEAWKQSEVISQALDEKALMDFATGVKEKGNAAAFALAFRAKYKKEYSQTEGTGTVINNNLTIENLSIDELKYRIARSQEVLMKTGQLALEKNTVEIQDNIIDAEYIEVTPDE